MYGSWIPIGNDYDQLKSECTFSAIVEDVCFFVAIVSAVYVVVLHTMEELGVEGFEEFMIILNNHNLMDDMNERRRTFIREVIQHVLSFMVMAIWWTVQWGALIVLTRLLQRC